MASSENPVDSSALPFHKTTQTDRPVKELRLSLQVWGQPRFLLTLDIGGFLEIKQLISFICTKMGLVNEEKQTETYLLMLDDSIVLNLNSIRDNDRLTLIQVQQLVSYLKSKSAPEPLKP